MLPVLVLLSHGMSTGCGGEVTNGTRPGQDYASIKMEAPADSASDCEALCCADLRCATWVFVPDGLYPSRPAGTFCWLKAVPIDLKGDTCDNGKPGCVSGVVNRTRPDVVFVLADDLGYNELNFMNTTRGISTPHLDALASTGVVLKNYYVAPICSPTRSALMTGRYTTRLGTRACTFI